MIKNDKIRLFLIANIKFVLALSDKKIRMIHFFITTRSELWIFEVRFYSFLVGSYGKNEILITGYLLVREKLGIWNWVMENKKKAGKYFKELAFSRVFNTSQYIWWKIFISETSEKKTALTRTKKDSTNISPVFLQLYHRIST